MHRRRFITRAMPAGLLAGTALGSFPVLLAQSAPTIVAASPESELAGSPSGPWRRLFLDASVVEEQQGLSRVFHPLERHPGNPVLKQDQPWEAGRAVSGPYVYGAVMQQEGKLRLWYQLINQGNHIGYAESTDGLHWTKPSLGLIEFNGSRQNNLVVSAADRAATGGECHNPSVLHCPWEADAGRRFAMFGFDGRSGHARVAFSPDGLRWRYAPESEAKGLFTSSDVVNFFWDPYQRRYGATWKTSNRRGRAAGIAWSSDALTWTKPVAGSVFGADDLDPDATQVYGMPVFPYQGMYLGLPWIYHARYFKDGSYSVEKMYEAQKDSPRHIDVQLAWSWNGINWTRPPERAPLLACGAAGQFDAGMVFTARAPVVRGDQLHLYYGGCDLVHDEKRTKAAIGLATLRLDGFCSLRAGELEGWFITRRETLQSPAVIINGKAAPGGFITAEILDRQNRPVPGFERSNCLPFTGDAVRHELRWKTQMLPAAGAAAAHKFRFWLRRAEIFSFAPA
jgi:hypothetical protein